MANATQFDAADYLKTPAQIAAYLTEALDTGDSVFICTALETVARATSMIDVERVTNPGGLDQDL